MRKHFSVIDSKTGMGLVYSECSYNMACFELEREADKQGILLVSAKKDGDMMRLEFSNENVFYYDEERGYLLKENVLRDGYIFFTDTEKEVREL